MVKTLRCSSCGAGLRNDGGQPNVVCEYCNSFVRVADDKQVQFDMTATLTRIMEVWTSHSGATDFAREYQIVADLMEKHRYLDVKKRLDRILEVDSTQARAWFYKSLLPILENESVLFKGSYVNIVKLSQITDRRVVRMYLKRCGLKSWQHKSFLSFYRSTDFLFDQHMRYLDKAIEFSHTEERIKFLKEHKEKRIMWRKKRLRRRNLGTWGLIFLLFAVIAGCFAAVWYFYIEQGIFG
jgi:hypothetical protein